jgi:dTDP-4-amino-4,6-dideoxygalactose transaminase
MTIRKRQRRPRLSMAPTGSDAVCSHGARAGADRGRSSSRGTELSEFIPFALPDVDNEEIESVVETLRSGWITTGPKTKQFECEFAAFLGGDLHALAVNSATAGLHLAMEAIGIGPGDEVITTSYTFTATAEVIRYMGAHPVFVDIDPNTFCIDPAKIEAAVMLRTKAIIPVHYGGMACDMEAIQAIAKKHNLKVVEDAAHALPTRSNGHLVGTLGTEATVFSFYATKTLATGEGGMVVTRNPDIANRIGVMRLHGISKDAFDRYSSRKPSWRYEVVAPGFKYNLTDVAAAIGIEQLKKVRRFHARRVALAARYDEALRDLPLLLPPRPTDRSAHAWHLYVVQLLESAGSSRDEFIDEMAASGIGTSVHYIPLHLHPYWRDTYGLRPEQFPNATRTFNRIVSLPLYTRMTDADQDRVIRAIRSILQRRHRAFEAFPENAAAEV